MKKVLFFFGQLSDEDVDWLGRVGKRLAVQKGQDVIREGQPSEWMFVILSGRLSVRASAADGREIARLGGGEIVGEMSFVDSRPPSATVTALEPAVLLGVPKATLRARLESEPGFAGRFYKAIAVYLAGLVRRDQSLIGVGAEIDLEGTGRAAEAELEDNVLDNVHLAGARFDLLVRRVGA